MIGNACANEKRKNSLVRRLWESMYSAEHAFHVLLGTPEAKCIQYNACKDETCNLLEKHWDDNNATTEHAQADAPEDLKDSEAEICSGQDRDNDGDTKHKQQQSSARDR